MRINVYAEEMTDRVEIVEKVINGQTFTGVRFYLYMPITLKAGTKEESQITGPFLHSVVKEVEGTVIDDDSSAVTFWGKRSMVEVLMKAIGLLNEHYIRRKNESKSYG